MPLQLFRFLLVLNSFTRLFFLEASPSTQQRPVGLRTGAFRDSVFIIYHKGFGSMSRWWVTIRRPRFNVRFTFLGFPLPPFGPCALALGIGTWHGTPCKLQIIGKWELIGLLPKEYQYSQYEPIQVIRIG